MIFDVDGDGDLDIVTNEFNDVPMVLVSDLSTKTNLRYLSLRLEGSASNRSGFGARVIVSAGGRDYVKVNDGKSGYLSQSVYPRYFGLDGAVRVDRVELCWPSGKTESVEGPIETNQILDIQEER